MKALKIIFSILIFALIIAGVYIFGVNSNFFGYLNLGNSFETFHGSANESSFEEAISFIGETALKDDNKLEKWNTKIKIRTADSPSKADIETLNRIIESFNTIKGFPGMELVEKNEDILISYATNESYKQLMEKYNHKNANGGSFCLHYQKNGYIYKAEITVAPRFPQGFKNSEVLHELFHSIGFYNNSSGKTSILNSTGPVKSLSSTDILSFMMIYNKDIKVGTSISELKTNYSKMTFNEFLEK